MVVVVAVVVVAVVVVAVVVAIVRDMPPNVPGVVKLMAMMPPVAYNLAPIPL